MATDWMFGPTPDMNILIQPLAEELGFDFEYTNGVCSWVACAGVHTEYRILFCEVGRGEVSIVCEFEFDVPEGKQSAFANYAARISESLKGIDGSHFSVERKEGRIKYHQTLRVTTATRLRYELGDRLNVAMARCEQYYEGFQALVEGVEPDVAFEAHRHATY